MNLEFTDFARLAGNSDLPVYLPCTGIYGCTPLYTAFAVGTGDPNSGFHAYTASTLPAESPL